MILGLPDQMNKNDDPPIPRARIENQEIENRERPSGNYGKSQYPNPNL